MSVDIGKSPLNSIVKIKEPALDSSNGKKFRMEVMKLYEDGKRNFILNFSEVKFIDSSGIGALLSLYKAIGNSGSLSFCHVNKEVRDVLAIVNMQSLIPIYNSEEEALKNL